MTIDDFDFVTNFKDGEGIEYIVEYILADDSGFCHRASPFLMSVGTTFEHNYGTYKVISIDRKAKNIIVYYQRLNSEHKSFDILLSLKQRLN